MAWCLIGLLGCRRRGSDRRHACPDRHRGRRSRPTLRVAAVQGGGPQGTRAINSDPRVVFDRHLEATRTIAPGSADLVVWPENVIDVAHVRGQPGAGRGRGRGRPNRRAVRGRHHRGCARRSLPQRPGRGHTRRSDRLALREGAPGPVRRVHAVARSAACVGGADGSRAARRRRRYRSRLSRHPVDERPDGWHVRAGVVISWEVFFGRPRRRRRQRRRQPSSSTRPTARATPARSCRRNRSPRRGCGRSRTVVGSCRCRPPASARSSHPTATSSTAQRSASRR